MLIRKIRTLSCFRGYALHFCWNTIYLVLDNMTWRYLGMAFCFVAGIIFFVVAIFSEKQEYNILRQEPLLFDYEYLKELKSEYISKKKNM